MMGFRVKFAACAAVSTAFIALPTASQAQNYERPPAFSVSRLGIKPVGENYRVVDQVQSDGMLRVYSVQTRYGAFAASGDAMLRMRINELIALHKLEQMSDSETFGKALASAGLSPLKFAGRLIADPAKTIGHTASGLGNILDKFAAGAAHSGKTQDDAVSSLLGVTEQKRMLAARLGVDPYTDYAPLSAKLTQLSQAAAAGGLVVTGALMAVPGAVGIAASNLSTVSKLGDLRLEDIARDYTAPQILNLNRQRLLAMQIDPDLIERLLANRNYTPVDMAAIVAALDGMRAVAHREVFLHRVAEIDQRSVAIFLRRQAEMLAQHQAKTGAITGFVAIGRIPFNVTRSGTVIGLMPIDALAWTEGMAPVVRQAAADAQRVAPGRAVELQISGQATPLARRQIKALGWKLTENVKL
jgi:hypothetical protein